MGVYVEPEEYVGLGASTITTRRMILRMMILCFTGRGRPAVTTSFAAAGFGEIPTIPATATNAAVPLTQARRRICPRDQRAFFVGRTSVIPATTGMRAVIPVSAVVHIAAR